MYNLAAFTALVSSGVEVHHVPVVPSASKLPSCLTKPEGSAVNWLSFVLSETLSRPIARPSETQPVLDFNFPPATLVPPRKSINSDQSESAAILKPSGAKPR